MAKVLSPWCKQAKIRLIELDMTVAELARKVGLTREYTSAIVNGRMYSEPVQKTIQTCTFAQEKKLQNTMRSYPQEKVLQSCLEFLHPPLLIMNWE